MAWPIFHTIMVSPPGSGTPCAARLPCTDAGKAPILRPIGESRGGKSQAWQSGGAVVLRRRSKWLKWGVLAGALCVAAIMTAPGAAHAQGFFDFLFGGPQQRPPPPSYPPPPPAIGRIAPAPLGQERVNENAGTTGHGVAFCVRLCDGQHFPLERMANATPAETCKAICPTSATKVYFGSEIDGAVAGDGARYADLNTAFLYRKHLVANCSCNGKDPFGLATFDVKTDPTLRPGDIVSTKEGLMTYSGRSGQSAFTPVAPSTLGPQSRQKPTAPQPAVEQPQQEVDDEPGTIVHPQAAQPAGPPPNPGPRSPAVR
jgi:hypothetical protein